MKKMSTDAFFRLENVFLVVGATNNDEKYGSKVFLDLRGAGYNVVAINQHGGEVLGTPAYVSVTTFLDRIEQLFTAEKRDETIGKIVLVLVVPPPAALAVVTEALRLGVTKAWFQPGAESKETIAFCEANGIDAIHNQCIMVQKP